MKTWQGELNKWLKESTPQILVVDGTCDKSVISRDLKTFFTSRKSRVAWPVLIISYDSLRIYRDSFDNQDCGLLICDEGKRS